YGDVPTSVRAMKAGAVEFLTKPIRHQEFLEAVQAALREDGLRLEREREVGEVRSRHQCLTAREEENHANRQHQRNDDVDGPDSRKASPCRLARCMLRCMSPEMARSRHSPGQVAGPLPGGGFNRSAQHLLVLLDQGGGSW